MTRKEFKAYLHRICRLSADDLEKEGLKLFDKMTPEEITSLSDNKKRPDFLAREILCALVKCGIIDRQWNAEGLKKSVARLKKIARRYG